MNSMDAGDAAQMTMWLLTEAPKQASAMQRNRVPDQDLRCFSDACRPHLQREHRSPLWALARVASDRSFVSAPSGSCLDPSALTHRDNDYGLTLLLQQQCRERERNSSAPDFATCTSRCFRPRSVRAAIVFSCMLFPT